MRTELFLALRHLRPRRSAVSLITVTSLVGVILGVTVLMVVLAVMTGFTERMKQKLVETQAHFQIDDRAYVITDPSKIVETVKQSGGRACPVMQGPVLAQYKGSLDPGIMIFGVNAEDLKKQFDWKTILVEGELDFDNKGLIISRDIAMRWRLGVGDKVMIHSAKKLTGLVTFVKGGGVKLNDKASAYLPTEFTIKGIYEVGKYDFDRMVVFSDIDTAAELFNFDWGSASAVLGWSPDPFKQDKLLEKLKTELPAYRVVSWEEQNQQLLGVLAVEKRMMFFLLIFIVLVAAFSIANTLITSIYQKTREIGMLKALGMTDRSVTLVFVFQGFLIGLIGSVAGVITGSLVIAFRNDILALASRISGTELFPKRFYYFSDLPAMIVPEDVLFIVVSSVLLCTLGALLPALRAARLAPADALRY
ncbi:MAG: ABC transporter permease [Lentisphaerae bacterium]|nr:ABC transporter permease [Lentisphaerota bacterium]